MPQTFDFTVEFNAEFDGAIAATASASEFRKENWLAAGYRPPQDEKWWRENGPRQCRAFADWYESQPDVRIWITPDGQPAIELEIEVMFGDVPVKMAPDLIVQAATALVIIDLKSGSSVPLNRRQLGIYACGIERAYGVRPRYGTFFMAKGIKGKDDERTHFLPPVNLDEPQYSYDYFCREFATLDRAIKGGIFLANPGKQCQTCGVNRACLANGGELAAMYQPPGGNLN